jgi:LmbE family N-acetylglucosaminyl deacetylase
MATVVFVHAHPDDEAIATGGTMAKMSDEGHRVVLVTATRGELGEIPVDGLAPGESLTDRREAELDRACAILGVARQVYLPYLDSGMAGEASNGRPGSFASADVGEAAVVLAGILDEEEADVLVTYDEHGGYGHPDHVQVHRVCMAAADLATTPVVYLATMNRDFMTTLAARRREFEPDLPSGAAEGMESMGEPASRLTTEIDVTDWIDRKRESMRVHASQISEDSFFLALSDEEFVTVWGREWYIRVRPPATGTPSVSETELRVDADSALDVR